MFHETVFVPLQDELPGDELRQGSKGNKTSICSEFWFHKINVVVENLTNQQSYCVDTILNISTSPEYSWISNEEHGLPACISYGKKHEYIAMEDYDQRNEEHTPT